MAANNGRRFCQDCGQQLHPGHSRVCAGRQQPPQAQAQPRAAPVDLGPLTRRIQQLEARLAQMSVRTDHGVSLDWMRVPAAGQPQGTVNRVFAGPIFAVPATAATDLRINQFDISEHLTGFQEWARGFSRVTISAVSVVYTATATGLVGGGAVMLAFDRASEGNKDFATSSRLERSAITGSTESVQLRVTYESQTPFERYLVGIPSGRIVRPFGRVHMFRRGTAFLQAVGTGPAFTGDLGFIRAYVQCACLRETN